MVVGLTPAAQAAALHEQDFMKWTWHQVIALRAAPHGGVETIGLDDENFALEIERSGESHIASERPAQLRAADGKTGTGDAT